MATVKPEEKKVQFTLVVEYDVIDEATIEGVKELVECARGYGLPVKAELSNLPPKMTFM